MTNPLKFLRSLPALLYRMSDNVDALFASVQRQEAQAVVVVWGKTLMSVSPFRCGTRTPWSDFKDALSPEAAVIATRERITSSCFSVPVTSGRAEFFPQHLYKLERWLLLGPGRVKYLTIGQNTQDSCSGAATGIAGRYGEGTFDTADVGNRICFEVE